MNLDILWKQYAQTVELYKFYMELTVKFNVFYYAVTGGILSFYFANPKVENIQHALILPIIMSFSFAVFFIYGGYLMKPLRKDVFEIRDALGLKVAPDVGVLSHLLYIFAFVFIVIALGCIYLVAKCH